ncbi:MAG: acyltransferase family protein [Cytophagaceae bacterium]
MRKAIYFPGLNGLRAICAIAVVVSHITLELEDYNLSPFIFSSPQDKTPYGLDLAGYGVDIFFVISGFLITYLLQAEKEVQPIDIRKFYLRRILRIWPLYYLYLITSVIAIVYFGLELNVKSLVLYLFYAANVPYILRTMLPFLAHYWSLGVEEQFYLFWPWFNKKIRTNILPVILIMILVLFGTKVWLHFTYPESFFTKAMKITRFHTMLIGAAGAILYKQNNKLFLKIVDNKVAQCLAWLIILLVTINKFHIASIVDNEIICGVALVIIIGQINIKNRILNLEIKALDFLGRISYGIYVFHPLLIFLFSKILRLLEIQPLYKYFIVYFTVLTATILVAYISYNYFEKYFLNLKRRFVVVDSTPIKPGAE